jgi:hypothetical protein
MACVWNLDTGAAFKGPLTIMDVDTRVLAKRTLEHFILMKRKKLEINNLI